MSLCIVGGEVLKFGFGRDALPQNLKVDPYKYQFFKKKWPIHIPIVPILGQILSKITQKSPDFSKIFLNLSQFWLKFGQIFKNRPIHIPNFAFYKGSFIYQEADFATHVGCKSPGSFVLSTPLPRYIVHRSIVFVTTIWNLICPQSYQLSLKLDWSHTVHRDVLLL